MIRPLIYWLFMFALLKTILEYLQSNLGSIFSPSVVSGLLLAFGVFAITFTVSQWLSQQNEKNLKSEISSTKALLTLKEEQYLQLEKELKSKDTQIEDLTKKELKIKTLESDLAISAENLTMSKIETDLQNKTKITQDEEINSYINRLNLLLNINKYYELSDFELQNQVSKTIAETTIYYEEANKQLESIMPPDYYSNRMNTLRRAENYEFDSLLKRTKQEFSDKYKNDILLLTEVLISRTGGNKQKLTTILCYGDTLDNHTENKPIFDNIGSAITQLESLTKKLKGFNL